MGEVYKATDTRLDRTVAIKVLPEHLAENSDGKVRFEREARAISQLNHPHICTLHDVGEQDGIDFLVMEHIEGETLADRLGRGALPIDEALGYGIQIANGLDKAHRAGIVHRDLKPGNIMLTKSGVKLLDFGLAKLVDLTPLSDASDSPTMQKALTKEQTILGTLQYMAPEQLDARSSDARSDIFAFGAILYEMVTGRRAFSGKSQASLIVAIMEHEPQPISSVESVSPPMLDAIVSTCLTKDPEDRWHSAGDLARQLQWVTTSTAAASSPSVHSSGLARLGWIVATLALVVAAFLAVKDFQTPPPPRAQRLSAIPPDGATFASLQPPAISPDGSQLAFVGRDAEGNSQLWLRSLDKMEARPIPGTDDAVWPFWSPDGRFLAFSAQGRLKRVDVSGGPTQIIQGATGTRGGTWNRDDVILFSDLLGDVRRVSANGGEPTSVTERDTARGERSHRWPQFLPDGRHFLFYVLTEAEHRGVYLASLDKPGAQLVLPVNSNAIYASRHLLYVNRGVLTAHAFDPDLLEVVGEPFTLADSVAYDPVVRRGLFAASETGVAAYRSGAGYDSRQLTWYDRAGTTIGVVGEPGPAREPRLSWDVKSVFLSRLDFETGSHDVWLEDLERGVASRLTFEGVQDWFAAPSPDGERFAFSSSRTGAFYDIYVKATSGTGAGELVTQDAESKFLTDWSRDGNTVVFQSLDDSGDWDVVTLSLLDGSEPVPFVSSEFSEQQGRLSSDGRWLAYVSNETGRFEVYVQPFPATGAKWRISSTGGFQPRWRGDGKELFFLRQDERLVAVSVRPGDDFVIGEPQVLFETRLDIGGTVEYTRHYDVAPDGQRFLLNTHVEDAASKPISILTNWPSLSRE